VAEVVQADARILVQWIVPEHAIQYAHWLVVIIVLMAVEPVLHWGIAQMVVPEHVQAVV
jgi:hypothetical protein